VLHPAMLQYLDQSRSVGPGSKVGQRKGLGLNENLAREILELHTLGVGAAYSQADVTEFAELLTGVLYAGGTESTFQSNRAEPGAETVLGRRYGGGKAALDDIRAALGDLALRPETAAHLARKLAVHFLADAPPEPLVAALAARYLETGGALDAVYELLLSDPAATDPEARKARQPFDFLVAAFRALDLDGASVAAMPDKLMRQTVVRPLALLGQRFQAAPGPDGWPEAAGHWLTPQGLAGRITWAMAMPVRLVRELPDPRDFAARALGAGAAPVVLRAVAGAQDRREAVGLVLAAPGFNRR
jgi:uncharacterized protein (DUF1800 family)